MSKKENFSFVPMIVLLCVLMVCMIAGIIYGITRKTDSPDEPTEPTAPRNEYNEEDFYYEDGFLRYQGMEHMVGIDVSVHQGVIDWQKVANAGVEFAIIRAGYRGSTVGEVYTDAQLYYNMEEAAKYGIQVGIYFFSQALTAQEAVEEAAYVCQMLEGYQIDLPIYFDWEYLEGRVSAASNLPLTDFAISFCEEIRAHGFEAGVYFNQSFGYSYLDLRQLQDYHLWLAEYHETPSFRYHFDCLQYSESGQVDGIETAVDLDILFLPQKAE